jgi:hypothetical protein
VAKPARRLLMTRWSSPLFPFYQRYPFRHATSIRSADDRGCIDFELGVFCNRIPKAANSSVISGLASLKRGTHVPSKPAKAMFRSPSSLSRTELDAFEALFKFAVVRNPFARTLSAYLDKIERKGKIDGYQTCFSDFMDYLERGGLYRNAHWAPQFALLLIPPERYDFFGRVESFDSDMQQVYARLREPALGYAPKSIYQNYTGASDKARQYYTSRQVEQVRRLFACDFEGFGYEDRLDLS